MALSRTALAVTALGVATAAAAARADDPAAAGAVTQLDAITVTATRSETPVADVPGTVSVIDARTLERNNASTPAEAVRYEPGVSVGNQPARGGSTNYVIRGVGGNRVLLLVDGVPVPDMPGTNAGAGTYTRDFVDLDSLKRIEIVRGPASALYGSDALGGVVAYVTRDPADYLDVFGKDWYVSTKLAFDSADQGLAETVTTAARAGNVEALALYTRRDGQETQANGSLDANPANTYLNNFLGKLVFHLSDIDTLKLTAEHFANDRGTDLRTDLTTIPGFGGGPSVATLDSRGRDTNDRDRVALDYVRDAPLGFVDRLEAKLYYTGLARLQRTRQVDSVYFAPPPTANTVIDREYGFFQDIWGGDVQLGSRALLFGLPHDFTYGVDLERTSTSHPRDATMTDLTSGTTTKTVFGETYPDKNFPDTDTTRAGAYVQDSITMGRLGFLPAVRFDYYRLDPHPDQQFANSNGAGFQVSGQTATEISPKLGVTWKLDDTYTAFGQYAHGFRAPPYDNANFGFRNPLYGYEILPSPDLKPETSDGVEAGLRGRFADGSSFSLAGFYNRYSDFIDTKMVGFSSMGLMQFQYVNLSKVAIWGAEARGEWRFAPGWSLLGSAAWARGEDEETHASIDSVDPAKVVAGISYAHPADGWSAGLTATHAWAHDRVSDPSTDFRAPAYTTLDLAAGWDITKHVSVNGGVFNLTDEKYFNSQDVIGLAANSRTLDLYAQPGRTFAVNATVRW